MIVVPGAAGEIGILARHAPLVAMLKAGSTRVYVAEGTSSSSRRPGSSRSSRTARSRSSTTLWMPARSTRSAQQQLEDAKAELERVEAGASEADRWQLEQRIRHAANQLGVSGASKGGPRGNHGFPRVERVACREPADGRGPSVAMKAYAPGIYPRSDALVQATATSTGAASPPPTSSVMRRRSPDAIAVESEAGFDLLADGMLAWQGPLPSARRRERGLGGRRPHALSTRTRSSGRRTRRERRGCPAARRRRGRRPRRAASSTLPSPYAFGEAAGIDPREVAASVLARRSRRSTRS